MSKKKLRVAQHPTFPLSEFNTKGRDQRLATRWSAPAPWSEVGVQVMKDLVEAGYTPSEIGRAVNLSSQTVRNGLKRWGIPYVNENPRNRWSDKETRDFLNELKGVSTSEELDEVVLKTKMSTGMSFLQVVDKIRSLKSSGYLRDTPYLS